MRNTKDMEEEQATDRILDAIRFMPPHKAAELLKRLTDHVAALATKYTRELDYFE